MFEIVEHNSLSARIKVIGIGGGGGNAVNTMRWSVQPQPGPIQKLMTSVLARRVHSLG